MDNSEGEESSALNEYDEIMFASIPKDLTKPEVRLDLETPLEWFFIIAGIIAIIFTIGQIVDSADREPLYIVTGILAAVGSFYLRSQTDCTYILDNMKRVFLYRRTILGMTKEMHVSNFCDIHTVAVQTKYTKTKHSGYWSYNVIMILKSGEIIQVTSSFNHDKALQVCNDFAEDLADHLDVEFVEGEAKQVLEISVNEQDGNLKIVHGDIKGNDTVPMYILVIMLIILLALSVPFFYFGIQAVLEN